MSGATTSLPLTSEVDNQPGHSEDDVYHSPQADDEARSDGCTSVSSVLTGLCVQTPTVRGGRRVDPRDKPDDKEHLDTEEQPHSDMVLPTLGRQVISHGRYSTTVKPHAAKLATTPAGSTP